MRWYESSAEAPASPRAINGSGKSAPAGTCTSSSALASAVRDRSRNMTRFTGNFGPRVSEMPGKFLTRSLRPGATRVTTGSASGRRGKRESAKIGRASCRERVESAEDGGGREKEQG